MVNKEAAMNKLEGILTDNAATLFAMGQDWTKGDGSASKVDVEVDKAKQQIKNLFNTSLTHIETALLADIQAIDMEEKGLYSGGDDEWENRARTILSQRRIELRTVIRYVNLERQKVVEL
jgi:hypothetical protein